jgi:hypothetical protein
MTLAVKPRERNPSTSSEGSPQEPTKPALKRNSGTGGSRVKKQVTIEEKALVHMMKSDSGSETSIICPLASIDSDQTDRDTKK